jgi:hypothetical protein
MTGDHSINTFGLPFLGFLTIILCLNFAFQERLEKIFTAVLASATVALVFTAILQHYDTIDAINAAEATAKAAQTQAKAAAEANRVARESNITARRPWIPVNLSVSNIIFGENNQADVILDFKFRNIPIWLKQVAQLFREGGARGRHRLA